MGRARVTIRIVDVDGSLRKFIRTFPQLTKDECTKAIRTTARRVLQRMEAKVAVGPDAPHLRDDLSYEVGNKSLFGRIGILEDAAQKLAAPGSDATQGEVAIMNEYKPDRQPFMGNSLRAEADAFAALVEKGLQAAVRSVSSGG